MQVYVAQSIGAVFSILSVPLYVLECAIIVRHWRKGFNNSFYRIFLATAFTNLVLNFIVFSIPVWRFLQLGWFIGFYLSLPACVPVIFNFITFFAVYGENFLTLAVIAHRLSAILWPMDFEQAWRFGFPIFIVLSAAASSALCVPNLFQDVKFFNDTSPNISFRRLIMGYVFVRGKTSFNAYQLLCIVSLVFFGITNALNLAILIAYKMHKSKRVRGRDRDQQQKDALEFRLLAYTLAMFGMQVIHSSFWIMAYAYTLFPIKLAPFYNAIIAHYVWINDLRVLVFPSWFLYWASSEISGRVKTLFKEFRQILTKTMENVLIKSTGKRRQKQNQQMFMVRNQRTLAERRKTFPTITQTITLSIPSSLQSRTRY